jgi:hypothetical protein
MTLAPPPTVPIFSAGRQPQQADFTAWWFGNVQFHQSRVVFRARQATATTTLPTGGTVTPIAFDTIDEDPFGGWSSSSHSWTPPVGYSGWYQVTVTLATAAVNTGNDIRALLDGTYTFDLATVQGSTTHTCGVEGQFTVYLIGGQDNVKGSGSLLNASASIATSITAGRQSSIEVMWLGE